MAAKKAAAKAAPKKSSKTTPTTSTMRRRVVRQLDPKQALAASSKSARMIARRRKHVLLEGEESQGDARARAEAVIELISTKGLLVIEACSAAKVSMHAFYSWLALFDDLEEKFNAARRVAVQHDVYRAKDALIQAYNIFVSNNEAHPAIASAAKNLADHYRWQAKFHDRILYGEKIEHTGANGGPIQVTISEDDEAL